jgi:hypothetical protein
MTTIEAVRAAVRTWGPTDLVGYRPHTISVHRWTMWLAGSVPGDRIVYAVACSLAGDVPASETPRLVRAAYRSGDVHLVQRRLGPARFEYIAERRARPRKVPLRMAGDERSDPAPARGRVRYWTDASRVAA